MFELTKYPEWRQLYEQIQPLLASGKTEFSYEELDAMAHLDIRSDRGRSQFYRFRRELLKNQQLWMENVAGQGYAVIQAKDHPVAALRRVKAARRKVTMARAINTNVHIEEMTPDQRCTHAATSAVLYYLGKSFQDVGKKLTQASEQAKLSDTIDVKQILKSISK